MSRLPGLINALARHDQRGQPTISHIARQVRDGGLIDSKRPGAGAALMTFRDAATLLMGTLGDARPLHAVAAVKNLRRLQPQPWDETDRSKQADLDERLAFLKPPLSFAEAVEQLIVHAPILADWHDDYVRTWQEKENEPAEGLADLSMRRMAGKMRQAGGNTLVPGSARTMRIIAYTPGHAAEIHLGWVWDQFADNAFHAYYAAPDTWATTGSETDGTSAASDCLITIEAGLATLLSLHEAIMNKRLRRTRAYQDLDS